VDFQVPSSDNFVCSHNLTSIRVLLERFPITHVIQKSPSACRKRRFIDVLFQLHEGMTIVILDCDV